MLVLQSVKYLEDLLEVGRIHGCKLTYVRYLVLSFDGAAIEFGLVQNKGEGNHAMASCCFKMIVFPYSNLPKISF
jgi:hypothetical protein